MTWWCKRNRDHDMLNRRHLIVAAALLATTPALAAASSPAGSVVRTELREEGLVGRLHALPNAQRRPAVIMLNGSDGGIPSGKDADDLAASGYPTLALAYFKDWRGQPDGVPASLNAIPLEYFFRAIDWLKRQPQVDSDRIVLMGQSRGGELVLLLASLRTDVAGVIAFSPSDRVWSGIPARGATTPPGPAWTLNGRPVPFQDAAFVQGAAMREWFVRSTPKPAAIIPVEKITGPVLLISSTADKLWPSDVSASAAAARLSTRKNGARVQNLQFADASHLLMGTGPGITKLTFPGSTFTMDFGGTAEGTARARAAAWEASKRFLAAL
jgi:dienelactone hydrolase